MSHKLLKEAIELLIESPLSDAFEHSVAKSINSFKDKGVKAVRPPASTSLPDVLVSVSDVGDSFIEVKMSHTDNLANPRVFYNGTSWQTNYTTPVAKFAVDLLNASSQSQEFLRNMSKFVKRKNIVLSTTRGGLKEKHTVTLDEMVRFVEAKGNRYILSEPNVDLGALVTKHYTEGKTAAAHYLQAKDDFYMIGDADPLGLNAANGGNIPMLSGLGDFKVRVSTRSKFYEIQTEIKIKKFVPATSNYSVLMNTSKINPFVALVNQKVQVNPEPEPAFTKKKVRKK